MKARKQSPRGAASAQRLFYKDEILERLGEEANIAQFVSFSPELASRFTRITGVAPAVSWPTPEAAIEVLLAHASQGTVNVRSFDPRLPESRTFVYGLDRVPAVVSLVHRLAAEGLYTIVNETIDINDGGVSGVLLGDLIEFAPNDTPRCVEKPGVCSLPRELGIRMLTDVYGFSPELTFPRTKRVEFSIHPSRCGVANTHTIVWEIDSVGESSAAPDITWPNRFSKHIGDKVFGLLVANAVGARVPYSTVVSRAVAPFSFGAPTGTSDKWIRTAPVEQRPGLYTTLPKWVDPFALLAKEDPSGQEIASVLSQESVDSKWSGAALTTADGELLVEGVKGRGDSFMLGNATLEQIPSDVRDRVIATNALLGKVLGDVRFEWVDDGTQTWVVQLHKGRSVSTSREIVPGRRAASVQYDVTRGIDGLRSLIAEIDPATTAIELVGEVGITSHFGDLLRRAKVVSRIASEPGE